jgi:hypothetical protein
MDKYEEKVRKLEREVMRLEGVEAMVQGIYIPGRVGGDVAISINQGHANGRMNPRLMLEFVDMLIHNLKEYRKCLR